MSRAVECDNGERTAEHTSPLSFTSESCGNKQKRQEKAEVIQSEAIQLIPTEDKDILQQDL